MDRRLVLSCFVVLALWLSAPAIAQPPGESSGGAPEDELADLLAILDEETEIATRTKMNSDFVPGIVTVLQGDELEALGIRNVWEAMALVPGVQPVRDPSAGPSVVVRGIDFPFNSGNIKIMVDSVPLTREAAGLNGGVLLLPIEQVERIEFIRGPGSVMYGEFAFMGLVNIVTRRDGNRVFLRGDSSETVMAGAVGSWKNHDGSVELSANLAGGKSNDAEVAEPRTAAEDRGAAILALRARSFDLSIQVLDRDLDETTVPPQPVVAAQSDETTWAAASEWTHAFRDDLRVIARGAVLDTDVTVFQTHFDDRVVRGSIDMQWDAPHHHSWLGSVEYSTEDIARASQVFLGPPGLPPPPPRIVEDVNRDVLSLTLQDRIDLSKSLSVTGGLRYSDYSDLTSRLTPRLSVVWRPREHHIVKAQYAEGFRSPTFFELYGTGARNPGLDFEVNETTEVNYVFRRPNATARVTAFRSELREMIFVRNPPILGFANERAARSEGIELEWVQQITPRLKVLGNASRVRTRDNRGPTTAFHESTAQADWIGDLAILVHPTETVLVTAHLFHVGERDAASADPYDLLDLTVTRRRLFGVVDLRVGVKNLLDDREEYLFTTPVATAVNRYGGRTAWLQVAWSR